MPRFVSAILLGLFVVVQSATCSADIFEGAPEAPKGFDDYRAAQFAVVTGIVKAVKPPKGIPDDITEFKNVEYKNVDGTSLTLNVYVPKSVKKATPCLVFIHGGGWSKGKKEDYLLYNLAFAKRGYITATVQYRLVPKAKFPGPVEDVTSAIRFLKTHAADYNIDANKIAAVGGSAGGHLAMMVGYADNDDFLATGEESLPSSRVQAVINFYGVVDCTTETAIAAHQVKKFIGKKYKEDPEPYKNASPISHLTADDPPTLTFHGTIDELVPIRQADMLHAKLNELGIVNYCDRVEGWPHSMDVTAPINERCQYIMAKFLEKHLPLPE